MLFALDDSMLGHAVNVFKMAEDDLGDVSSPARQLAATDGDFGTKDVATPSSPSSVVIPALADEERENAEDKDERDQVKECEEEKKRTSDSLPSGDGETSVVATEQACVTGIVTPVTTTLAVGKWGAVHTVPCFAKTRCGKPYLHLDGVPWATST